MVTGYIRSYASLIYRDFPSTAAAIARQCGIITNEKVDEYNDLILNPTLPIKPFDPEDVQRICKSIVLSGKELSAMKDEQWNQVESTIFGF
jgi:magnesium-transporting ATPase (P-type)